MEKMLKKFFNKETILYLIFGAITTLIDFITYIILRKFGINIMIANFISWTVAVIFAFVTNKIYVFNSRKKSFNVVLAEFLGFVSARIASLIFHLVFIYVAAILLGANDILAKVISSIFVIIINYVLSKFFVFNKNNKKEQGILEIIKENMAYILSFIIPLIILILVYYSRKIYPFGDNTYLKSDCYHQYLPFLREMYSKLKNHESIMYSWHIGLGTGMPSLYAYYLASPTNFFIAMVDPIHLPEVINTFILLKTSLASLCFAIYLVNHFKTKKMIVPAISIFYAMSSYMIAYSWNIMWLDCICLLPIIILGLERLVKEKKCLLYVVSLALAIISNYYIAIMICIFCVLYYVYLVLTDDFKKNIKTIGNFIMYSLIAGGIAAFNFLPAYMNLKSTASNDFEFPKDIQNYFSVLEMVSRSLMDVELDIFSAHNPNLYCTMLIFLLLPLYLLNTKIKIKEKIGKVALWAILLVSFSTNIPNYIWHGFHYPNSLPARESFIYIFIVLVISFEALKNIEDVPSKQIYEVLAGAIFLVLIIEEMFVSDDYKAIIIYTSIAFLVFYGIVLCTMKSDRFNTNIIMYMLLIVTISEVYVNVQNTGFAPCGRSAYLNDNVAVDALVKEAKENDEDLFYRTEKKERRTKNDASWGSYYGASIFSSAAPKAISDFYGAVGMEDSMNAYGYYGATPLMTSMLSVKYLLSNQKIYDSNYSLVDTKEYELTDYLDTAEDENKENIKKEYYLYKYKYYLPLGFMLDSSVENKIDIENAIPFENLNSFYRSITGNQDSLYERLSVMTIGDEATVEADEETHMIIYLTTSLESISVEYENSDGVEIDTKNFNSMKQTHMVDLGVVEKGCSVTVRSTDSEVKSFQMYAYKYFDEKYDDVYNKLSSNTMELTKFETTSLEGRIEVEKDGLLFTSIPYDKGWEIYVDGKKANVHGFKDAFISVYLTKGYHEISFKYTHPGFKEGVVISILSLIILITLQIINKKYREINEME